ncbi:MAG TPA: efflux RND transporter periplasmic adaptor subunit [Chloroflexota bacterium]|nr:efflux RND transporter periplasmic adaptor subunit [Chloroflexota bacterium]
MHLLPSPLIRAGAALGGLTVALLVTACGSQSTATEPKTITPARPAQVVSAETVRRGTIQHSHSYSGEIRAREQIQVLPEATGRVERLLVDVGAQVHAGDTLAILDQDSAQIAVLTARANLSAAEARLATIQSGGRADDGAAAEAALAQQQIRLQNMRSGGRAEDIKLAQAALEAQQAKLDMMQSGGRPEAIRQAQSAVDAARAKLDALQKGATNELRQAAQSAVQSDRAALAAAEAAFAAIGGTNAADLQAAQSDVENVRAMVQAAQSAVASADAALNNLNGSGPADIQQAQSAYDAAQAQLRSAQAALDEARHPTQASIADAEAALEQSKAQRQQAQAQQSALEANASGPCVDAPGMPRNGTACGSAKAAAHGSVSASEAAVESAQGQLDLLKRGGSPAQQAQLQATVDQATSAVKAAQLRLEAIQSGGIAAERAQLQAQKEQATSQLTTGQQNFKAAEARQAALQNGSHDAQVKAASSQVTAARERLAMDQAHLEELLAGPTDEDMIQAEAQVDQAQQALALAEKPSTEQDIRAQRSAVQQARLELEKARTPHTEYDVQQQEQAVAQAEALLRKAQNPYTAEDLQAAQAAVDQAQAQLDLAELGLKDTRIVAPVDGRVADRLVAPGARVSPQSPIVTLVPPALEVVVNVDESQLGQISEGQSVQLQVPAYPNVTFGGTVNAIAPRLDSTSRTAAVHIVPNDEQAKLRAGMFARLSIVTAAKESALMVPRDAVLSTSSGGQSSVVALDGGAIARRAPVKLGIQDDRFVEILEGLDEDDLVATTGLADLHNGDAVAPQTNQAVALGR